MLSINWSDVMSILNQIQGYLIAIGVIIVAAVVAAIVAGRLDAKKKFLVRTQALVAAVAGIAIVVNLICTGPMSAILTLASGSGTIDEETSEASQAVALSIAQEGIVLMQNDDGLLPLADANVNVFGWASVAPCYGGTGSGALSDAYHIVDLLEGLHNAGISTNEELSAFYTDYRDSRPEVGMWAQDWTLPEPPVSTYTDEMIQNARDFSDTALIVLTRSGGEHVDLPRAVQGVNYTDNSTEYQDFPEGTNYLGLSQTEKDLVDLVTSNFDNVVVIINSANTMEVGWIADYSQIKSVLWVPGTGQNGFNALGQILTGEVNPSGKNSDTFVADLTQTPTWNTFAEYEYDNMDEFRSAEDATFMPNNVPHFINYSEGIYVGYKFYETAAAEGFIDYDDVVVYPFGSGLSYTTFTQEMGAISESDGQISFDVTVTNTGSVAGKDVVEVFYNPPYTDGGIEKASANLVAFDKTKLLEPGESQTVTISFDVEDMASFDTYGAGCYVLEAGDYVISINNGSHDIIDSQTYTVASTVTYGEGNARTTDQVTATTSFAFAEGADKTYLSRANSFANYDEATAAPTSLSMAEEDKAVFVNNTNWVPTDDGSEMPTTGASNAITASDLRGASYDDPRWDELLDNLTYDEMASTIALGGYQTLAIKSVGKAATTDCDGPASINNNFTGVGSIGFPAAVMIANTWNKDIAYDFGDCIGAMADEMNVSGWYAPAMNTHRNAFCGRNFEYFSEDGVLAGRLASQAAQGSAAHGVYAYIKHFAMNEMETNRWGMLCTWSTEQAIREIYLKPFEIVVKDFVELGGAEAGYPLAVMSSYNYIGTQWAGASDALLNTVLRDEWGFEGFVLTDYFGDFGYMEATRSIYNGGDLCLVNYEAGTNFVTDQSATTVANMRRAMHDLMYVTVNSRAQVESNASTGLLAWQKIMIGADVVIVAALIAYELLRVRKGYAKRAEA